MSKPGKKSPVPILTGKCFAEIHPESTKRLISAILKVKPTADMSRPGAQPQKPKKAAKRQAKPGR
jgi:hypothetical protein